MCLVQRGWWLLLQGGDLYSALRNHPDTMRWERLGRKVALDVALGINYLHTRSATLTCLHDPILPTLCAVQPSVIRLLWLNAPPPPPPPPQMRHGSAVPVVQAATHDAQGPQVPQCAAERRRRGKDCRCGHGSASSPGSSYCPAHHDASLGSSRGQPLLTSAHSLSATPHLDQFDTSWSALCSAQYSVLVSKNCWQG